MDPSKRHFFGDGSVAQGTGFCVYRELLAKRSQVFRDLFSVPQPEDSQLISGCPVVHLSDTPAALKELFCALLYRKKYTHADDAELDVLLYRIRLAHKYGIDDLLVDSVQQLKELWPTNVALWSKVQRAYKYSSWAITAVNLARLTDTHLVLPSALYVCCQLPEKTLFDGAAHSDVTVDVLCPEDLQRCVKAKVQFTQMRMDYVHTTFSTSSRSNSCATEPSCTQAFDRIKEGAVEHASAEGMEVGVFEPWDDILNGHDADETDDPDALTLCRSCLEAVDANVMVYLFFTWVDLPRYVGVKLASGAWPGNFPEKEPETYRRIREEAEKVASTGRASGDLPPG
ncbi:hypothetical protein DAEQUDRAFT_767861 [Daedalea quercina L-15889]|uniref:BTB domain-containing protein n=1 Tax=Daedalea quercina L-15889 TaxID=1314783 RepID=A0A165N846_9APHY|nr:hypothetical protein DAEQUDRAFT_767861 [Daedalea quercina L-15889]